MLCAYICLIRSHCSIGAILQARILFLSWAWKTLLVYFLRADHRVEAIVSFNHYISKVVLGKTQDTFIATLKGNCRSCCDLHPFPYTFIPNWLPTLSEGQFHTVLLLKGRYLNDVLQCRRPNKGMSLKSMTSFTNSPQVEN